MSIRDDALVQYRCCGSEETKALQGIKIDAGHEEFTGVKEILILGFTDSSWLGTMTSTSPARQPLDHDVK